MSDYSELLNYASILGATLIVYMSAGCTDTVRTINFGTSNGPRLLQFKMTTFTNYSKSSLALISKRQLLLIVVFVCIKESVASDTRFIAPSNHTLNEWIENGTSPFTNDTTVVLLPGLHLINSTRDRLITENKNYEFFSIEFSGQQKFPQCRIVCLHYFSFTFIDIQEVILTQVTLESCYLSIILADFSFSFVKITFPGLNISNDENILIPDNASIEPFVFRFSEISIIRGYIEIHNTLNGIITPAFPAVINISDSIFQGTSIHVTSREQVKGIQWLDMKRVAMYRFSYPAPLLEISLVHGVIFTDIIFQNNYSPNLYILGLRNITYVKFHGHFVFNQNSGELGMDLYSCEYVHFSPLTQVIFHNNTFRVSSISFRSNQQIEWTSSVVHMKNNVIKIDGHLVIYGPTLVIIVSSNFIFENNRGLSTGTNAIMKINYCVYNMLVLSIVAVKKSTLIFFNNTAQLSGGLTLIKTTLYVVNIRAEFGHNQGGDGGAIAFYKQAYIIPEFNNPQGLSFSFHHNVAKQRGGAIFVEDSDYVAGGIKKLGSPFFLVAQNMVPNANTVVQFDFLNNSAGLVGNELYGGWIELILLDYNLIFILPKHDNYAVASNPIRICKCTNSVPVCETTVYHTKCYPGQVFEIEAVAVGQRMGIVPSTVMAHFAHEGGSLGDEQNVQSVGKSCTVLQYTVHSDRRQESLNLTVEHIGVPSLSTLSGIPPRPEIVLNFHQFSIVVTLFNCPEGFELNTTNKQCQCLQMIEKSSGIGCDYTNFSIIKTSEGWLNSTIEHLTQNHGVLFHNFCPFDYCRRDGDSLTFHLETPDDQCAFNRSGILCGACQANLSQVLGTSRCKECSNDMLAVIIPVVFLSGVALVAFLFLLSLTVSTGTMNGLIFYANIVRASQAVFFPPETSFLSIFIAWLNLDVGIETCFYNGLDAYAKTWLQFVFPLYIWFLVIIIIVVSHYSSTVSRLFGNNAVQVLATLFLLSYAKILQIVIAGLSFTNLLYPDGYEKKVWLEDGNVDYLRGKHISLFIVSFLTLVLFLVPYTLSLLSIQLLQKILHYRVMFWVNRLMPLFDAYTGPYKPKHRYWTGLLLLLRNICFLSFALNYSKDPTVNLLVVTIVSIKITACLSYMAVYKTWLQNALELLFLLNLGLLSFTTSYQVANDGDKTLTTYLSVSFSLFLFTLIILYHIFQRLLSIQKVKSLKSYITFILKLPFDTKEESELNQSGQNQLQDATAWVTHTSIELTEPLIH